MVRYRRNYVPGGTYFFTVTLFDRRSSVLVDHIGALRTAFRQVRHERPFSVDAIVVLPDHFHLMMTLPLDDRDFSARLGRIKGQFTSQLVTRGVDVDRYASGKYSLWQRRFWEHTIRNEDDLVRHVDYTHFNPVKHGLVTRVCDWPFSSFHAYVRDGAFTADWGGDVRDIGGGRYGER